MLKEDGCLGCYTASSRELHANRVFAQEKRTNEGGLRLKPKKTMMDMIIDLRTKLQENKLKRENEKRRLKP